MSKASLLKILVLTFLLMGCGRSRQPEPIVITPEAVPSDTPAPTDTPLPTLTPTPNPPTPSDSSDNASESSNEEPENPSSQEAANSESANTETTDSENDQPCSVESHLDLTGYPDLESKMGCAIESASLEPVAINEFGEGPEFDRFMLWFSINNHIDVLLPNRTWQSYPDTWTDAESTFPCNPLGSEPTSPPLPRRGFGKLWCSIAELQATMGFIPREERLCQHAVLQQFETGRLLACFEDATIRYFRILNDGTWDLLFVQ